MSAETMPDEARHCIDRLAREKEAERARADAAEARIVELEAVEKTLRWSVSDSEASLAAAEQRAADALARAEKAEGENKRLRDALVMISLTDWYTRRVRQHPDGGLRGMAGMLATRTLTGENPSYLSNEVIIERFGDPRASREAQPAPDGGDNG